MVRLLLPLLPFRLAGIMVSSYWGSKDFRWRALSLYLGTNRVMFLHGSAGFRVVRAKERFPDRRALRAKQAVA